ncbi:hypothetical protein MRB53_037442 [Persea americana]|nr:hypothetical protein MRB53_037442 [Persea americana]
MFGACSDRPCGARSLYLTHDDLHGIYRSCGQKEEMDCLWTGLNRSCEKRIDAAKQLNKIRYRSRRLDLDQSRYTIMRISSSPPSPTFEFNDGRIVASPERDRARASSGVNLEEDLQRKQRQPAGFPVREILEIDWQQSQTTSWNERLLSQE